MLLVMELDIDTDNIWATYTELGSTAHKAGDTAIAETMFAAARDEARRRGFNDWRWETSLRNLATVYEAAGKEKDIPALTDPGMSCWSKLAERSTAIRLCRLEELAQSYTAVGRYFRAANLYQQLIELIEETFGRGHPTIIPRLLRLAWIYGIQKKHSKALEAYSRAQALREQGSD